MSTTRWSRRLSFHISQFRDDDGQRNRSFEWRKIWSWWYLHVWIWNIPEIRHEFKSPSLQRHPASWILSRLLWKSIGPFQPCCDFKNIQDHPRFNRNCHGDLLHQGGCSWRHYFVQWRNQTRHWQGFTTSQSKTKACYFESVQTERECTRKLEVFIYVLSKT